MPREIDIANVRFGSLVAIKKVESNNGRTQWLCKCDCGTEKIVRTTHLRSGMITSCGCHKGTTPNESYNKIEKKCVLCGKIFETNYHNKKYCYECSPSQKEVSSAERLKQTKRRMKHLLVQYKGGKCENCGYDKCEAALQFHHRNPEEKEFNLSHINFATYDIEKLYEEIDKCDLLCANCHAEIHFE